MQLELRGYQLEAVDCLRTGIRDGHRAQLLASPTGSGKTVIATHLMHEAGAKGSRALFICDRVALVDQTSAMFDQYGVPHGVMQSQHWRYRPWERLHVATAQTLARRGWGDFEWQLLIWDECHTQYKTIADFVKAQPRTKVIGLSATPFTDGLANIFSNVVNVATTDQLVQDGYLVPLQVYVAKSVDMRGARLKFDGEWAEDEIEQRALTIVGDVVSEWVAKTTRQFTGPVKTIVFSATVAHGDELCRRFQNLGFDFQQVSYKDGNDDRRRSLIAEFRKPDSTIIGLVSCEALAKGFDVPDIRCGISARPYRKSLSAHIQQVGRVMRPYPGKEFAVWLDHSGNFLRFRSDTEDVFARGVSGLNAGLDKKVRREPGRKEKAQVACGGCGYIMGSSASCPMCGWERPKRRSEVSEVVGELHELPMGSRATTPNAVFADRERVCRQFLGYALKLKKGDWEAAERLVKANYRTLYGKWPSEDIRSIEPEAPLPVVANKMKQQMIAYAHRRRP